MSGTEAGIAVVIPTLNEESTLAFTLRSLQQQSLQPTRVVVVDGGSTDRTRAIAIEHGAEVIEHSIRGRGHQIAAGVRVSREAIVAIVHADMVLPMEALKRIQEALQMQPDCAGGCLGHRFQNRKLAYRIIEWFDKRRAIRGMSYGDQAQFFRRTILDRIGGFPDQAILEDVELSHRLKAVGPVLYLDLPAIVSGRRFERNGLLRTLWQNWRFRRAYRRGGLTATRDIFARYYPRH